MTSGFAQTTAIDVTFLKWRGEPTRKDSE